MSFRAAVSAKPGLHGALKLARLLELPEREMEKRVRELEGDGLFARLKEAGVLTVRPYPQARFAARRFAGWGLRTSSEGVPELLDGDGELPKLIAAMGEELFKECFLQDEGSSDNARAKRCGIKPEEARRLREYIDRLYIQEQFESASGGPAPATVFSAVAGIEIENGRPILAFFHREVWKGRYDIDDKKRAELARLLGSPEARRAENLLRQLEFLDRRKSTLFRVLEALLPAQSAFLLGRDPDRRKAFTQRELAADLDITPSVLNRLISNKSVQLPWGLEAPLKVFLPSAKSILLARLQHLALARPELSDEGLAAELRRLHGARLSRRSIAQYRKELRIGGQGRRTERPNAP